MKYLIAALLAAGCLALAGCGVKSPEVVVYTSQDEVYATPIFQDFEKETGIHVRAVFDSEAVQDRGAGKPVAGGDQQPAVRCFLEQRGVPAPVSFPGARRVPQIRTRGPSWAIPPALAWCINTNLLPSRRQRALENFGAGRGTNAIWRGKVALAYPLFGTTATHFLALRQRWGDDAWYPRRGAARWWQTSQRSWTAIPWRRNWWAAAKRGSASRIRMISQRSRPMALP